MESKEGSYPLDLIHDRPERGQVHADFEMPSISKIPHINDPGESTCNHGPTVRIADQCLHAGDRTRAEIPNQALSVEVPRVRQPQPKTSVQRVQGVAAPTFSSQRGRTEAKQLNHDAIHLTNALEPGGKRDLADRQVGLIKQSPCEVCAPRASHEVRCGADVLLEQTHEVPRAVADAVGELLGGRRIKEALGNQANRGRDLRGRLFDPEAGQTIRSTHQARPKASSLRFDRIAHGTNVARQRPRLAVRLAIDPRCDDTPQAHTPKCARSER